LGASILTRVLLDIFKNTFKVGNRHIKEYKRTSGTERATVLNNPCVKECLIGSGWQFPKLFLMMQCPLKRRAARSVALRILV
jgi:hypothetical protein